MKKFNISSVPTPRIHHLPIYYSFLFDKSSVYSLSFAQKRIQSLSQGVQKNGKYKVTTTVTNGEIQHFSVPCKPQHVQLLFILI